MHHNTAVRRLRSVAEGCDKLGSLLDGEDGLVAVYAFGPVLDRPGADLDAVNVALVVGLPAAELGWGVETPACTSLAHLLRLDKAPVLRRWRPAEWPVANHEIRRPMLLWSREDGVQTAALDALAQRRAEPFRLADPDDAGLAEQISGELETSAELTDSRRSTPSPPRSRTVSPPTASCWSRASTRGSWSWPGTRQVAV